MKLYKTTAGNYRCYHNGYYIFIFRRPHGGWAAHIKDFDGFPFNGYFTTSMITLTDVKKWIREKIG